MIIKLDGLTSGRFAALAAFLASDQNTIEDAEQSKDKFASLTSIKNSGSELNVVLEVTTEYSRKPDERDIEQLRGIDWQARYAELPPTVDVVVPARYLLDLFESIGMFPAESKLVDYD